MASSSSNPDVTLQIEEEHTYPYPSNLSAASFISVKLNGRDKYRAWKTQMLCLLKSHGLSGFIHGRPVDPQTSSSVSGKEKVGDHHTHWLWKRSDSLVKGWILGSLSEETVMYVLDRLAEKLHQQQTDEDFSAKDVWDELRNIYGPIVSPQCPVEETAQYLLECINTDLEKDTMFSGKTGDELIVTVISSKDFGLAIKYLKFYKKLHSDAVLMAIAQNFPSQLNMWEYVIVNGLSVDIIIDVIEEIFPGIRSFPHWLYIIIRLLLIAISIIVWPFLQILGMSVRPLIQNRLRNYDDACQLLYDVCGLLNKNKHSMSYYYYYRNSIFEATRQNSYKVVYGIMLNFPTAHLSVNEEGHNIFQNAVVNRSRKIYNLLYVISEQRNIHRTIKDPYGNNLLHLAARLAPHNKLNLISGAALQMQRELQWFKEVERFVCPLVIVQKNSSNETPQTIFTRERKELMSEGEKWMKSTAESYTITTALIITIVFAAAITVPGGNNQNTGIPIFTNNTAFTIFAISDAISLFATVTSLLMFLSILTARSAEQDFLFKLPTKLIIELATLFISTTAMVVAFAATLYIVFGQSNSRILIPIVVLTCLPITSFVTLQFPLVVELMSATYGRSIFGRRRDVFVA